MTQKNKAEAVTKREMNRKGAITKFAVIFALAVIGVFACFANFRIPYTSQRYIGFFGAIEGKMGIDLKGGVLAVFDTEGNPTPSQIDATANRIESLLYGQGFVEATVVRQGTKIRVEVPGMQDTNDIFTAIGTPASLEMRRDDGSVILKGDSIQSVEYYQDPQTMQNGVKLIFTSSGGNLFRNEISNATIGTTKIHIWLIQGENNESEISAPVIQSADAGLDNTTVITGAYTKQQAQDLQLRIESGLYAAKLTPAETSIIPPTLGSGAITAGVIAVIAGLIFIFILMWVRYGDLGLLSNLSVVIFSVLFLFALAVVGSVQLTLPGIAGMILSLAMAADANIIIFERIRDEYKAGKRMAVAVESGFNKSISTIVDANVTAIIAAGVLYVLGEGAVVGFAITLLLGIVISMFSSLVITRSFAKLYLYINSNNERRLRLKKDDNAPQPLAVRDARPRSLNMGGTADLRPSINKELIQGNSGASAAKPAVRRLNTQTSPEFIPSLNKELNSGGGAGIKKRDTGGEQ